MCAANASLFRAIERRYVDLDQPESEAEATAWWYAITTSESEGMVIKPLDGLAQARRACRSQRSNAAAASTCRVIYGPTYTEAPNLDLLRQRGLAPHRALALREFMLGHEAVHRFVDREPLYRVHECVFGVLALESESVDPRL